MKRTKLIEYRKGRALTQKDIAKMYGVTQQTWSKWEVGRATPTYQLMKRIADDARATIDEIFFGIFQQPIFVKRSVGK